MITPKNNSAGALRQPDAAWPSKQKAKVLLFVVNRLEFFISHRLCLATEAKRRGWRVIVAAPQSESSSVLTRHSIEFRPIQFRRGGLNPIAEMLNFISIWACISSLKPDIAHLVTVKPVLYGGIACTFKKSTAVVAAIPGLGYAFTRGAHKRRAIRFVAQCLYKMALRGENKRIIFQNEEDKKLFEDSGIVKEEQASLIPGSGVDPSEFQFKLEKPGPPIVLFASRLLRDKGISEFVEAARRLKTLGSPAHFVLAGDIDEANPSSMTYAQIADLEREGCIEWWGYRADMPSVLEQAHIVCLPSYREGLPKVLIEAAAVGRAIITTNVPGCRDTVEDRVSGLLVAPREVSPLVCAIQQLIANPILRQQMGKSGRSLFERRFTTDKIVRQTFQLYP